MSQCVDDLVLMCRTIESGKRSGNRKKVFESNGLKVNFWKTKTMVSGGITNVELSIKKGLLLLDFQLDGKS